uniref:Formimidoyltransferase-cyclodeaminase n=1 Tax=Salarias fasciatus TaxID=181472 RepID=A0A672GSL4_SALFA
MAQLVECVPNFSEGRNQQVIDAIAAAISDTAGCSLLDVDPGASTNRTVYTFVGSPEAVVQGALNAAQRAFELIDMSRHKGEHPRTGALDVCPFVPVQNVTMDDCVRCAEDFGRRLADALHVPVYLYGEAARTERRRNLPTVRAGEYEALPEKLKQVEWAPDFGPAHFVPSWGATVTGARKFLIAYNVNLIGTKEQAHRIALDVREQGRGKDQPGLLKKVQGMGWYLDEANVAQVSTNILDFELTPLHAVYEEICRDAEELKLPVVGSQIVGLIPLKALLDTADFYIRRDGLFIIEEEHKVRLVVSKLGLDSLVPASRMPGGRGLWLRRSLVAARTPAPGGGSVSAAIAAMGAALAAMVGQMTYGKRQFQDLDAVMRKLIPPFHHAAQQLLHMVDADASAFNQYMQKGEGPRLQRLAAPAGRRQGTGGGGLWSVLQCEDQPEGRDGRRLQSCGKCVRPDVHGPSSSALTPLSVSFRRRRRRPRRCCARRRRVPLPFSPVLTRDNKVLTLKRLCGCYGNVSLFLSMVINRLRKQPVTWLGLTLTLLYADPSSFLHSATMSWTVSGESSHTLILVFNHRLLPIFVA